MSIERLKQLADGAREVEEAVKPLIPDLADPGYVDNETWALIDWIAEELEAMYIDALTDSPLEEAVLMARRHA